MSSIDHKPLITLSEPTVSLPCAPCEKRYFCLPLTFSAYTRFWMEKGIEGLDVSMTSVPYNIDGLKYCENETATNICRELQVAMAYSPLLNS